MDLIGQTLGQYHIIEFVGAGGMASVYKAYQPSLDRHVAIKVLPAQHALTPGYKERFVLEARAVAQLSHPNILPIYDFDLEGDLSYFVMKYIPDRTLNHLMGHPLALDRVSHFLDQAAGALDHAHARGILHRDIKPANMLLEGDWLLLADFGVAKIIEHTTAITSSGHVFGTPVYISPEQAEGNPLDHHSDIYSLSVVLYEMVVGRAPFEDTNPMKVIFKHVYEPPLSPRSLRPDLPELVEQVILKGLSKEPADRYHCANDLAVALHEAIEADAAQRALVPVSSDHTKSLTGHNPIATNPLPRPEVDAVVAGDMEARNKKAGLSGVSARSKPSTSPGWMVAVAAILLLLVVVGVIIFLGRDSEGGTTLASTSTPNQATKVTIGDTPTPTGTFTPTFTPTPTPVPPTATTPPTPPAQPVVLPTATPTSSPDISGTLAIPVKVGAEFKVYVTGFDGAGINGPAPISLGNARQPMFRRDGQAIVVNGTSTGALRGIFSTDNQGQAPHPLNDRSEASWPVWSVDGTEIMFVDPDQGRTLFRQQGQLAIAESDYRQVQINKVNLVANNILWSDDNRLVFQGCADWSGQSGECGIWVTDAGGLDPVRLTSNGGLPMDARQGWLTYMLPDDGDWEIFLISLNGGGEPRQLTDNNSQDGLGAIAPDGQSVAYISNESGSWAVWTITLSDQQKQKWFELDPHRGTIDVNTWAEERMSWTQEFP